MIAERIATSRLQLIVATQRGDTHTHGLLDENRRTMRCPTCRAEQEWSDTCRRCGSDLKLLRAIDEASQRLRNRVLGHLSVGHYGEALRSAEHLVVLRRDAESERLRAVCLLLSGHPAQARDVATRHNDVK